MRSLTDKMKYLLALVLGGIAGLIIAGILGTTWPLWVIIAACAAVVLVTAVVFDLGSMLIDWIVKKIFGESECELVTRLILRDVCKGTCNPDEKCQVKERTGYFFGLLGKQPSSCECVKIKDDVGGSGSSSSTKSE